MGFAEIAVWTAVSVILVFRVAMLVAFLAVPVVIVRALYRQSEA
jgi:hypothetical protein